MIATHWNGKSAGRLTGHRHPAMLVAGLLTAALALAASGAARAASAMGPLENYLINGVDGAWRGETRPDGFFLTNEADPGSIYYLFVNAGDEGHRRIRVEVQAEWGAGARVGLLYGYQRQGPRYHTLVLEERGYRAALLSRGAQGLQPRISTSVDGGSGEQWRELVIVERDNGIELALDGQRLGRVAGSDVGGGAVGIVAMGTGRFGFRGFEVASPRAPAAGTGTDPGAAPQPDTGTDSRTGGSPDGATETLTVSDQGLQMPIWREVIPADWTGHHRIATNVQAGGYTTYLRDLYGPNGELVRDLGGHSHNRALGLPSERILAEALATAVKNPRTGEVRPSPLLESLPVVQQKRRILQREGFALQTMEIPFDAQREGRAVAGRLYLIHTPYPQLGDAGFMEITLVVADPRSLDNALAVNERALRSRELNAAYQARKSEHNRLAAQRNQAAHRNRMAQLRANHEAHQARMRGIYAASDARHQAWMDAQRSPSSTAGGDYGGHDAFIDQTHERTTFMDPDTGQEIHKDGQYDHWYTDGLGRYHGTDDPAFNPRTLPGDWQRIEPRRPGN